MSTYYEAKEILSCAAWDKTGFQCTEWLIHKISLFEFVPTPNFLIPALKVLKQVDLADFGERGN